MCAQVFCAGDLGIKICTATSRLCFCLSGCLYVFHNANSSKSLTFSQDGKPAGSQALSPCSHPTLGRKHPHSLPKCKRFPGILTKGNDFVLRHELFSPLGSLASGYHLPSWIIFSFASGLRILFLKPMYPWRLAIMLWVAWLYLSTFSLPHFDSAVVLCIWGDRTSPSLCSQRDALPH